MKSNLTYGSSINQAYWPLSSGDRLANQRSLTVRLNHLWNQIKAGLNASSEPRVWETKNTAGGTVWNAYDPASGRILRSASPSEVRIWLEERYYFPGVHQRF